MTYVVYSIASTKIFREFYSESSAKRSVTCANRKAGYEKYAYTTSFNYDANVVYTRRVKCKMSGKWVEIDSNTPLCSDPSSETYWSM